MAKSIKILFLFLTFQISAQGTRTTIYSGKNYGFKIEQMTDTKTVSTYFVYDSNKTVNSNRLKLRIMTSAELRNLVDDLRTFANYTILANYSTRNDSYSIEMKYHYNNTF